MISMFEKQRQARLIAIDEEMARLELEMLIEMKEMQTFLGGKALNDVEKQGNFDKFEQKVLNQVIREIKKQKSTKFQTVKIDKDTILTNLKPETTLASITSIATSRISPERVWSIEYNPQNPIYAMVAHKSNALYLCVIDEEALKTTTLSELEWRSLWSGTEDTAITRSFNLLRTLLGNKIDSLPQSGLASSSGSSSKLLNTLRKVTDRSQSPPRSSTGPASPTSPKRR